MISSAFIRNAALKKSNVVAFTAVRAVGTARSETSAVRLIADSNSSVRSVSLLTLFFPVVLFVTEYSLENWTMLRKL